MRTPTPPALPAMPTRKLERLSAKTPSLGVSSYPSLISGNLLTFGCFRPGPWVRVAPQASHEKETSFRDARDTPPMIGTSDSHLAWLTVTPVAGDVAVGAGDGTTPTPPPNNPLRSRVEGGSAEQAPKSQTSHILTPSRKASARGARGHRRKSRKFSMHTYINAYAIPLIPHVCYPYIVPRAEGPKKI